MNITQYYNLSTTEISGGLIAYQDNLESVNKKLFYEGVPIQNWPSDAILYVEGKNPTNYIIHPLAPWLTISKKARKALEEANIEGIQFLPIHVVHKCGIEVPGYVIVNVLTVVAALDYNHTEWTKHNRERVTDPLLYIWKVALQRKKIEGFDVFRLVERKTQVYVSEHFKECLEHRNASLGFGFLPVTAYE